MLRDIRDTVGYREAEALLRELRQPGTGQISDAIEANVAPDGHRVLFTGTIVESLTGAAPTRICSADLATGETRVLTLGPNSDRLPKFSPSGREAAFLSDRHRAGDFQLYLLDTGSAAVRAALPVQGWVEYFHWSPDGRSILLGVAGHGADVAGGQGAITSRQVAADIPSWLPSIDTGDETWRWRRAWVYEIDSGALRQVSPAHLNVWEVVWCGNDAIAAVCSPGPGEGLWYSANLQHIDLRTGESRELYTPKDQLGWPAASPAGKQLAVVEAVCSDRGIVAGDLLLIDVISGQRERIDTREVDVSHVEWRSERTLLIAGHRGFETVVMLHEAGKTKQIWHSAEITSTSRFASVSGWGTTGDCVLLAEGYSRAPEVGVIRQGEYRTVKSFDLGYAAQAQAIAAVERVSWTAPDGLAIQGWLLLPKGEAPHPLVLNIHGGPVSMWKPTWLGRPRAVVNLMLLKHGYAVFLPNPRGSAGRGQGFARRVVGDMGGADTYDYLSGLDHLVERGLADPKRLGVMGISYGGYMTSWLITQDARFAAAVSVAQISNQVTQHLISNIPTFVSLFLDDRFDNPGGRYFQRSPIMHARKASTPTLNICGALDRCTPLSEGLQFHSALLENGVRSVLAAYPEEGHGIQKLPAAIDYTARVLAWFQTFMPGPAADD